MQQAAIIPSVRAARSTRRVSLIALMKGRRSQAIQSELRARSCLRPTASRCGKGCTLRNALRLITEAPARKPRTDRLSKPAEGKGLAAMMAQAGSSRSSGPTRTRADNTATCG
jgi:hypothetical protein